MENSNKLSPLQLELLRIYSFNPTEEELQEIKSYLGKYFANRFSQRIGKSVADQGLTEVDLENWLNEENQ